jgi:hypothetical protein
MNTEQVWKFLYVDVDENDSNENSLDSISVKPLFQQNLWTFDRNEWEELQIVSESSDQEQQKLTDLNRWEIY